MPYYKIQRKGCEFFIEEHASVVEAVGKRVGWENREPAVNSVGLKDTEYSGYDLQVELLTDPDIYIQYLIGKVDFLTDAVDDLEREMKSIKRAL